MKVYLRSLALMTIVAVVCTAVPAIAEEATGGLRYTVTVTKFENQSGWHGQWDLGHAWDTVLTDMLNQTGKFIVLGETDMRAAALDERLLQLYRRLERPPPCRATVVCRERRLQPGERVRVSGELFELPAPGGQPAGYRQPPRQPLLRASLLRAI